MDARGIDNDPGWINRRFQDVKREIEALRSERRFGALPTTSATANMVVDAITGAVSRSTSSKRYKRDIADLNFDLATILKMRPRTWRDKADVEKDPAAAPRYVGFVAEELHDAGLGLFVGYDLEGNPESVHYDRLTVVLLIAVRFLWDELSTLRAQGGALSGRVDNLQTQVTKRVTDLETAGAGLVARIDALQAAIEEFAGTTQATLVDLDARLAALEAAAATTTEPDPPAPTA